MDLFKVVTLEEAKALVLKEASGFEPDFETVGLMDSYGRILAQHIKSPVNVPSFDRSTVDGYAVKVRDVVGASEAIPSILDIRWEVKMGETADNKLNPNEAIYVPTGGMLPEGADGVVMIENCEKLDDQVLLVKKPVAFGENILYKGDDLKEGELILPKGKPLSEHDMGVLASIGVSQVRVQKKIRIAVLSTGDEIVDVHDPQKFGQIRDINGYVVVGAAASAGAEVVYKAIVQDDFDALKKAVSHSLTCADLVILSGGSSVGTRDFTQKVIDSYEDGRIMVHGISIKPGKPTIVGKIGHKMVFGLPGHPAASAILFEVLVRPYLFCLQQRTQKATPLHAKITTNLHASPGKDQFLPVNLKLGEDGYQASPLLGKSGIMSLISKADGYIRISSETEGLYKGQEVAVYPFGGGVSHG